MDHDKATPQELRWRIAQLEVRLAEQVRINQDITGSTIWRATAPLRHFLTPLSKLKRQFGGRETVSESHYAPPHVTHIGPSGALTPRPWDPATSKHYYVIDFEWDSSIENCELVSTVQALGLCQLAIFDGNTGDEVPIVKIDFRSKGNGNPFKVFGFEQSEHWGIWTKGRKSQILLWIPATLSNVLRIEITGGLRGSQTVAHAPSIVANGKNLGPVTFSKAGLAVLLLPLDQPDTPDDPDTLGAPRDTLFDVPANVSKIENAKPIVSVLILNYNKPYLTFLAVCALLRAKCELTYEIIVLDNGSEPTSAAVMSQMGLPIRWIRLNENRFFGEGNNIAAEMARGEAVLFLNNDAFVEDFALDRLYASLKSKPDIGAAGPVFFYPDGSLQEAGAFVAKDGSVYQRGKGSPQFDLDQLPPVPQVDYVSAACLMVDRQTFLQLGGFDLRYDPAYYEDSDLCLRLLAIGLKVVLVKNCHVTHIENATTAAPENNGLANNITERHRAIFLSRWHDWLKSRHNGDLPAVSAFTGSKTNYFQADGARHRPINAVYTPYPLSPGGGERYLLATALAMETGNQQTPAAVITPTQYSLCRLNNVCHELGLPVDELVPLALQQGASMSVDRYVHMGNELVPSAPSLGKRGVFHCQFPFPNDLPVATLELGLANLATYDAVVVNSNFTRDAYLRAYAKVSNAPLSVCVIYPPVRLLPALPAKHVVQKEKLILSIGRFCPDGHAKRQDLIVAAFKKLKTEGHVKDWRLVLCGTVPNDIQSGDYFERLKKEAAGFDVDFILAPDRGQIEALYRRARVYVSATGADIKNPRDFHKCEHFGITVVEAMSAGCAVVVASQGGPAEIVATMASGFTFSGAGDLRLQMLAAIQGVSENGVTIDLLKLRELYSDQQFEAAWAGLWQKLAR